MRLTKLELQGFKSFADRTTIVFDDKVTAIVGPNGCGKSNTADAIRWGLGEQSAKAMRVSKMQNLIFNGSDARKPSNFAEVTLTFENNKGLLPPEYSTVAITRKLYRDGTSEYQINGVPCLLKDIQQLLSKVGLGPNSYAVIELAMIEDLLRDNNKNRRFLFESAAGILQYKVRKKEALQNLNDTEKNLTRIVDILIEVEEQLKQVQKEAEQAQKYIDTKKEYKENSLIFAKAKIQKLQDKLSQIDEQIKTLEQDKISAQTRITKHKTKIQELNAELVKLEKQIQQQNENYTKFIETIANTDAKKNLIKQKIQILITDKENLLKQTDPTEDKNLKNQIKILENKIDQKLDSLEELEFKFEQLDELQEDLALTVSNLQQKINLLRKELNEKVKQYNQKDKELHKLETQLEIIKNSIDKETEKSSYSFMLAGLNDKLQELNKILNDKKQELQQLQQQNQSIQQEILALENQLKNTIEHKNSLENKLKNLQHQKQVLQNIITNLEGYPKSIKFIRKKLHKKLPLINEIFYIQEEYKTALENYLSPYLNHFIVRSVGEALELINQLRKNSQGKANFIVEELIPEIPKQHVNNPDLIPILNLLKYDKKYDKIAQFLFANVYITEKLPENYPENITIIDTKGYYVVNPPNIKGGEISLFEGKNIGTLENLKQIENTIQQLQNEIKQTENSIKLLQKNIEIHNQKLLTEEINSLQAEINKIQKEIHTTQTQINAYTKITEKESSQKQQLLQQYNALKNKIQKIYPQLNTLSDEIETLEKEISKYENTLQQKEEELKNIQQEHNNIIVNLQKEQNELKFLKQQINLLRQRQKEKLSLKEQKEQKLKQIDEELAELTEQLQETEKELMELYEIKETRFKDLKAKQQQIDELKERIQNNNNFIFKEQQLINQIDKEIAKLKEAQTKISIEIQSLVERLRIEFQITPEDLQKTDIEIPEKLSLQKLERKINSLRSTLQSFGPVNLRAIETYKHIKERYDFILQQKQDIETAKENLLSTIANLDEEATREFLNAFNEIRKNFKEVFQVLFYEGDTCDLLLENPEEPLTSRILIKAKPKGKRPVSIEQLSGGEKTLTATALLFAIYLYKPSPFCLFDEVDAPLDDANVDKFNQLIKQFSENTQFILITHNKRTMLYANKLYGVSMPETGVSTAIPLSLKELDLAE